MDQKELKGLIDDGGGDLMLQESARNVSVCDTLILNVYLHYVGDITILTIRISPNREEHY